MATSAHPGNLVLPSDWGCWWILGFFPSIYILESVLDPSVCWVLCVSLLHWESRLPKIQSFLHYSLEKTQLRALGLSFLYIGLVPFSNLKKPAFVKLKKRSALVSRAWLSCPPPPTWSLPCSGPGLTLCSPSVQAFMRERSLQCKFLWKAELFLLLGSVLCCWVSW